MSRLAIPASIDAAPAAAQPLLKAVQQQLGSVPNLFRLIGNSPAALEGHLALSAALGKGQLPLLTRNRIAVALAELNGCGYCLSAHIDIGKRLMKFDDAELNANRSGTSNDIKADAAVKFAVAVAELRGQVTDAALSAVKLAGYSDAQIVEIVQHVALNIFTNYLNVVAATEIDFPVVALRAAA